jgi:hypothetical protein
MSRINLDQFDICQSLFKLNLVAAWLKTCSNLSFFPHQSYTTPADDAPSGMTGRGSYHVHSLFTDDDKMEHLKWEWYIDIKKDW